ncbi:uncharacterized protein LOC126552760 [Aphis gossypii]|uniref:uncharacterized protein LOC126552760 n=1 Tax=Aphis gossypii TaxID=80765 RepID=UPI002159B496|nr:uncharacterized protein LOC126552760 [Aphis gossypii]
MWAVVHFSFDNSVEPVPSYWLSKDSRLCAWPNNDNLAKKMRVNRTAPNKLEFTYYKCRVISKNIESLVDAQLKADKAQYTSDVSDFDKRKKKGKKKYSSVNKFAPENSLKKNDVFNEMNESHSSEVSSVLDDCDDDYLDKDYLPANQQNITHDENELMVDSDLHFEFDDKLIGLTNEEYDCIDLQEATNKKLTYKQDTAKKIKLLDKKELEHNSCAYLNTPKNMLPQSNTTSAVSPSPTSANTAGFQKLALNYLASLKIEMTKIADTQQEILTFIQTNNVVNNTFQCPGDMQMDHEVDYFISNWPLSDMDNLLSMEQKIKSDQNFRKQVVCELSRIGGKSLQNMIYKIMKRVFKDGILIQYTYYGLRNKENFSLLAINRAIFDAIKRSKFKNVSDDEIITTIGKWLTSAKSRLNKNNVLQI